MSTDNTVAIFNVLHCFIYIKVNPLFFTNSSKFLYHANNHLMGMTCLTKFLKVAFKKSTQCV